MIHLLENQYLKIEIDSAGAELQSIFDKQRNQEYLWQGVKEWWPRRAPVLFPIVGKLNKNEFHVDGNTYSLPQHGFARDLEFQLEEKSLDRLIFLLKSTTELLQKFPFLFELRIEYVLKDSGLKILYQVKNEDHRTMNFSIGAHPGFALQPGEKLSDYYIEFATHETLDRHLLDEGLFNGKTERVVTNALTLDLNDEQMTKDAIVFKDMKSTHLHLKSRKSDYQLKFTFSGFPYFGIWSKPGASFVCLEPWCGMADHKGFEGEFRDKEGIQSLASKGIFEKSFDIGFNGF